jgi:hypothetical protein
MGLVDARTALAVLLLSPLLLLPACAAPEDSEETASGPDPSAQLACRHFRNVIGDATVLTDDELRGKIKEVHDTGRVSEEPGVAEHSRAMLEAATAGDGEAFMVAAGDMSESCADAGL